MRSEDLLKKPVWVWGVPLWPLTLEETVEAVSALVEEREPAFFITANTHYAMLTHEISDLRDVNRRARFIVPDGAPLVWAARRGGVHLPERVAGSDLIFELCSLAARKGYRLFLAGGAPGVAEEAARRLNARYPELQIVGTAAPAFRGASQHVDVQVQSLIRNARPNILIVAATMPDGERWIATHFLELGVPVSVNLGAAIDFAAERIKRAPSWMQNTGLEWAFRLFLEPRRLFPRYARNAWFILRMLLHRQNSVQPRTTGAVGPADLDLPSE
jgi:N-acetylglucosaminyldiphosphoundecaprenol N-acetyl-beta-D-mannosaminyltransferase